MKKLNDLSDDEIDALLMGLFNGRAPKQSVEPKQSIESLSTEDLRRIRSKNHPDKWPNVDLDVYRAAVQEIDRRRSTKR
jgi:hypothetical protein